MIELMTVVAMISIFVVAAAPLFVNLMRDRRVNRAALQLVELYRIARTRALGRGQPVTLSWNAAGGLVRPGSGTGLVRMLEPVASTTAANTCFSVNWASADPAVLTEIGRFDVANGLYELADLAFYDTAGAVQVVADTCFSPRGQSFLRTGALFTPITGVPKYAVVSSVARGGTGLVRTVFIPPNGVARLAL